MTTLSQIKTKLVAEYKKSLNPSSKWYNEDLNTFKERLKGKKKSELERQLNNMLCINGSNVAFNNAIKKEMKKMEKAGMYNIKNMKATNALD